MGAHNITAQEPWQLTVNSTVFFVHEKWSSAMLTNDISLIKLPFVVTFNSKDNKKCFVKIYLQS